MTREQEYDLWVFLKRLGCCKHKPDRHSFTAQTEEGSVFVESREDGEIYICYETHNGERYFFAGTVLYALKKLIALKIKPDTIEM